MIFFNVKEAREYLIANGKVYTLRPKRRKEGKELSVFGNYRKWQRIGNVDVKFICNISNKDLLTKYLSDSGFDNVDSWIEKAKGSQFLYLVKMLKQENE